MFRKVTSTFRIANVASPELYESYTKVVQQLRKLENSIKTEFLTSPEAKLLWASVGGSTPKIRFETGDYAEIIVEHYANFAEAAPVNLTVDPTILNTLLHTKLLTDEEKRSLLQEQGILKPKEVTPTPEC